MIFHDLRGVMYFLSRFSQKKNNTLLSPSHQEVHSVNMSYILITFLSHGQISDLPNFKEPRLVFGFYFQRFQSLLVDSKAET